MADCSTFVRLAADSVDYYSSFFGFVKGESKKSLNKGKYCALPGRAPAGYNLVTKPRKEVEIMKKILAAAALKCLGGDMQARLIPYTDEERKRCWEMGIDDINRVMTLDDLVKGDDCIFSATAITDTPMMRGVQYFGGGARTMSVVMRYKSGTIRFIDTFHRFDKKAKWSIHL